MIEVTCNTNFTKNGEKESTYGCLHSVGTWTVSAYLQVEISVIELIIARGSEQTNLTCDNNNNNMKSVWQGKETRTRFMWFHTSVSLGLFVRSHVVPLVYWWAWYLNDHNILNTCSHHTICNASETIPTNSHLGKVPLWSILWAGILKCGNVRKILVKCSCCLRIVHTQDKLLDYL
jgi:hypothetical protein